MLLAPLIAASALAVRDVTHRPTGRQPAAIAQPVAETLERGRSIRIDLPQDVFRYRALVVRASAAPGRAIVRFRLCFAGACNIHDETVGQHTEIRLTLPATIRGGRIDLEPLEIAGQRVLLDGRLGAPAIETEQGFSWKLPLRRAREVTLAMAGLDMLFPATLSWLIALLAVLAVALRAARQPDHNAYAENRTRHDVPPSN